MSTPMALIVHGPAGCGKTYNAEKLRKAFDLQGIVDGYEPGDRIEPGHLHLSWVAPRHPVRARVMAFDDAMKRLR